MLGFVTQTDLDFQRRILKEQRGKFDLRLVGKYGSVVWYIDGKELGDMKAAADYLRYTLGLSTFEISDYLRAMPRECHDEYMPSYQNR
jgi:hypothetical protein